MLEISASGAANEISRKQLILMNLAGSHEKQDSSVQPPAPKECYMHKS